MNIRIIIQGFLALIVFLCLAELSLAQQTEVERDTVYQMEEIIISASKYPESPQSVGRNVTVITRDEIRQSIHTNISGLLAEQHSLHMIGAGQTPGSLQQGFLRNANSNHSVVMIDGVRISDPSTVDNSIDLSELSLTGVERIEIVRGSHSTLYGSSAVGGVINIITQKQGRTGFNADLETGHGNFGSGTYSTQNRINTNYTDESGLYANFGIDQQYANGLDATIDTTTGDGFNPQDQDDFRKLDLTGKIGIRNDRYNIYGTYRRADQKVDADQGAYQDDSNAFTEFDRDLFGYGAGYSFTDNVNLQFDGAYSTLNRNFVNDSSLVSPDGTYDGVYVETNGDGMLWENELKAVAEGTSVRVVAGLSASNQTMNTRSYTYVRDFDFESTTDLDSLDLKEIIYNGFLHSTFNGSILDENLEAFSLGLGARYSHLDQFGSYTTYEINPKYNLSSSGLVYGAVTTGFNAPSLYRLYNPEQGFGAYTTRGNENLDPEKSISYEIGWKQSIGQNASFELSLFKTEIRDVIEYVYLWNGSQNPDELGAMDYLGDTYINASKQDVNGLEASLRLQLLSNLSFDGNITLSRSTLSFGPDDIDRDYTGNNHIQIYESGEFVNEEKEMEGLTRRPSANAFLRLSYQPTGKLNLKVSSRFVGSRDDVYYSDNLGPFGALDRSKVSGYNLTDISARYGITESFSVIGKIENILNEDYVEINGYNTRGRGYFVKLQYQFAAF